MKYLCLIYGDEARWEGLSEEERQEVYASYRAFTEEAGARLVGGGELEPARSATTVRVRDLQTKVSDGPFAETKEQLAGYFVLECEDMDEALAWAARIPGAAHGSVEVRPEYVEAEVPA